MPSTLSPRSSSRSTTCDPMNPAAPVSPTCIRVRLPEMTCVALIQYTRDERCYNRSMSLTTPDFLVIGGGIIGISLARELRRRHPGAGVTLLEKEPAWGQHASGRNSGVLHAGFYYAADSLKARFTREGNSQLTSYCAARRLPINRCGKLVVARTPAELVGLAELLRRGRVNGVPLEEVTAAQA